MRCCARQLADEVSGLRVGLMKEGFDGAEVDVAEAVRTAAYSLSRLGVTLEEFSFPELNDRLYTGLVMLQR